MNVLQKKKQEGFTIIEVLIVLAIAGLIMLIVFLAVPALQRNARNTARNNDANLLTSAVNECLSNRNGNPAACQSIATTAVSAPAARELTDAPTYDATAGTGMGTGSTTGAIWRFGRTCDASGNPTATGATARQFAVVYQVEGGSGNVTRCIAG